jgi:penicillin G amidase
MRWLRRILYGLGALVALAAMIGGGGYLWLRTSLPQTTGTIAVPGLGGAVEIVRDGDGVVTIRAGSEADAFHALGFAHAQDRLFQMEMTRRLGAGRLAEVAGADVLNVDKLMRILGLYRLAEAEAARLPSDMRASVEAYAAGVNAFLSTRSGALPPEFQLMGIDPEPWRPADSLVWGKLMAMQLSGNWSDELLRYRLSGKLSPAQLNELWPAPPNDELGVPQAEKPDDRADLSPAPSPTPGSGPGQALPRFAGAGDQRGASNSFVVAGGRSTTGKPLLANDPHLGLQNPIQWYLMRMETPDLRLVGVTAPGVPMLLIGHNGHVAWTFTTTQSDTQDLFLEKLLPDDPGQYVGPGGPMAFATRDEVINVYGAEDVVLTVRQSRHGPILSDAPSLKWTDEKQVLALAWPALASDDATALSLYRINRARSADDVRAALADFDSPMQNIVYADTAGHIGFVAAGRMPIRKKLSGAGEMPAPGWSGDYDWNGFLQLAALPQLADPPAAWIATANNDIRPPGYAPFIGARWEPPYRYRRIAGLIAATPKHTAETIAAIQLDIKSDAAQEAVGNLLAAVDPKILVTSRTTQAHALLKAWHFTMDRDRPEPLIFTAWMAELNKAVLADDLGELFRGYAPWNTLDVMRLVAAPDSPWCDDKGTPKTESCKTQINNSWRNAIGKLADQYGSDPAEWRWGDSHRARFSHPVFDRIPVLRDLLHDPIATDGDNFTVNRATPRIDFESVAYPDVHGAGLRVVFDLADLDRSRFIIAGGQSGNPLSAHYGDQIERWRDGQYIEIRGSGDEVLTLVPSNR